MTDYSTLEEVLRAIRDLPYEGGSRRIGDALQFLVDSVFSPAISRDHAPKVQSFNWGDVKIHAGYLHLAHPLIGSKLNETVLTKQSKQLKLAMHSLL